jgi:hypothetical protein
VANNTTIQTIQAEGYKEVKHHLKVAVIEAINELRLELENR